MSWFHREKPVNTAWPRDRYEPVIRQSICTGEKVACMRDRSSGKLHELVLIREPRDLEGFCRDYGVSEKELKTIY